MGGGRAEGSSVTGGGGRAAISLMSAADALGSDSLLDSILSIKILQLHSIECCNVRYTKAQLLPENTCM